MNVSNAFNMVICEHLKNFPLPLSVYTALERTHREQGGQEISLVSIKETELVSNSFPQRKLQAKITSLVKFIKHLKKILHKYQS